MAQQAHKNRFVRECVCYRTFNELKVCYSRLISVGMAKMNKLKRKRLFNHTRGWYVLIDIFQIYTNIQVLGYKVVFSSGFILIIPSIMESFPFYTPSPHFQFSLTLVDQLTNLFDTCSIRTFLKSLWVAVRLKVTVQVSLPH